MSLCSLNHYATMHAFIGTYVTPGSKGWILVVVSCDFAIFMLVGSAVVDDRVKLAEATNKIETLNKTVASLRLEVTANRAELAKVRGC